VNDISQLDNGVRIVSGHISALVQCACGEIMNVGYLDDPTFRCVGCDSVYKLEIKVVEVE